jgi:Na+/H+ antiporter NhaD/arsenite permease-like protein
MAAVVLAVARDNHRFVAWLHQPRGRGERRGAWCAFGDITTLMVWQAHRAEFFDFFRLFVPSVVNFSCRR